MKIILNIVAALLIMFGVLMVVGATDPVKGQPGWLFIGAIIFLISLVMIFFANRRSNTQTTTQNVTLKIDVPGNVRLDSFKCKSCGGELSPENITIDSAGAPVVTCPYCHTTYQMTEEPKW
jgi:uncharacterized Zn-finger protein